MAVELTEKFLAKIAGWEVMKQARALLAAGKVSGAQYEPPFLRGVVQEGSTSLNAGLSIKDTINVDNLCPCRQSRQWGSICPHSVAVGLQFLAPHSVPAPAQTLSANAPGKPPAISTTAASLSPPLFIHDPGAAPCRLQVVLPPNFLDGLRRGRVSVSLEAIWDQKTRPLPQLPQQEPFSYEPTDLNLARWMESQSPDEMPAVLTVAGPVLVSFLESLKDHPRIFLGRSQRLKIPGDSRRLKIEANLLPEGQLRLQAEPLPSGVEILPMSTGIWTLEGAVLQPLQVPVGLGEILQRPLLISRDQVPVFLNSQWPVLQQTAEVVVGFDPGQFVFEPRIPKIHLFLGGGFAKLEARLEFDYGAFRLKPGEKDKAFWIPDPQNVYSYSSRDLALEQDAVNQLLRAGFEKRADQVLVLSGQEGVLSFFARVFPRLEREWSVQLDERLSWSAEKNLTRIQPKFEVTSSGVQWFDLSIDYRTSEGESLPPAEIQRLLRSGQSHVKLKNGKWALLDTGAVEELQEVLVDANPEQTGMGYRLSRAQGSFIESTLANHRWKLPTGLVPSTSGGEQATSLGELAEILRPYQKTGVEWFWFLRRNGFGGILADEMGLGKTLQALAFINSIPQADRNGPFLVVCPTSLLFNWEAELTRFTPQLKVLLVQGPRRMEALHTWSQYDVLVTSYGLLRRDLEHYRGQAFDVVILDEAQHIKNRQSQNAQAVKSVRARQRLVLTGTPLENSVLDLWSIFDFLMPGYLGSSQDFKERYEQPITRDKNRETQARLARRIRPFLLRRTKKEVAPELPQKIDQVLYCDLNPVQRGIYQQLLQATRTKLQEAVGPAGLAQNRMLVFTALLRLRQVCCDLRLVQPNTGEATAKSELFDELLEEVLDGNHRVLVFSQFVQMLKILENKLKEAGVSYSYLDGSTTQRGEVVQEFQARADIPVFLISLKAGGVGLNLTAADTVIHYDPWWNPAVEDQATGRAHRIGQSRVVTSYKLITRGTVEEKILLLQQRKREMTSGLVESEERWTESLSWDELQELLS